MTIEELIVELKKLPQDALVTMSNFDTFVNGEYQVTDVFYNELENCAEIATNYQWIKEDGKWVNDWEEEDDE